MQRFVEWLKETRRPHKYGLTEISSHTPVDYVRNIWTFLYWCLDDSDYCQYVRLQTVKEIKLPRAKQTVKETFTDEEITALFDTCHHESKPREYQMRDYAMLAVLLDTGIRSEELLTLSIGNTVLARDVREDSYIKVLGKGRKEREIPLGNKSRRALGRYIRTFRKEAKKSDTVFFSRHGGKISQSQRARLFPYFIISITLEELSTREPLARFGYLMSFIKPMRQPHMITTTLVTAMPKVRNLRKNDIISV